MIERVAALNPLEVPQNQRLKHLLVLDDDLFDAERYAFDNFDPEAEE